MTQVLHDRQHLGVQAQLAYHALNFLLLGKGDQSGIHTQPPQVYNRIHWSRASTTKSHLWQVTLLSYIEGARRQADVGGILYHQ